LEREEKGIYDELEVADCISSINKEINQIRVRISETEIDSYNSNQISEFITYFFSNLGEIWWKLDYAQKLALQDRIFPTGLPYDGESFRTDLTNEISPCINALCHPHVENGFLVTPWGIHPPGINLALRF